MEGLRREVQALRSLRHPHIVPFFGVCFHNDQLYLITKYCPSTLEELVLQRPGAGGRNLDDVRKYRMPGDFFHLMKQVFLMLIGGGG